MSDVPSCDSPRVPPQDIQAEASVLGAMMIHAPAVAVAREILSEADFYRPAHQIIFTALSYMADHPAKWGMPDLVTIRAALAERDKLDAVGGVEYLVALAEGVPSAANVEYYARVVRDKSRLRNLIIAGTTIAQSAFDGGEAADIITAAAGAMEQATRLPARRRTRSSIAIRNRIEEAIAGQRESVAWPWKTVTEHANPCAPGTVMSLCGEPGSGKSFAFQQAMLCWHKSGHKVATLHLEKDRGYHQHRALAQLAGMSCALSDHWQKQNPAEARSIEEQYRGVLDSFGETIYDDPDAAMNQDQVKAWISARAQEGARIIGVDPVTALESGNKPWEGDRAFVLSCESLAAHHGCSIVLVTHPRTASNTAPSMDALAGGRAYSRLVDCVMWLQSHNPPKEGKVKRELGPSQEEWNRTMHLCKTRDSTGQGMSIAMRFSGKSLWLEELGPILPKPKRKRKGDDDE